MYAEIVGVMNSIRVLNDLVKANHTLRNFNELVAAVSEVNAKLAGAWSVVLESQEKQATLAQRIGELEKEIAELKNWDREAERYQLTEIARGVFAYRAKPGMEQDEPPHLLCANCFTKREKAFLQFESFPNHRYLCLRCEHALTVTGDLVFNF